MFIILGRRRKKNKRNRETIRRKNKELKSRSRDHLGEVLDDKFESKRASFTNPSDVGVVGGVDDGDVFSVGLEGKFGERHFVVVVVVVVVVVIGSSGWKMIEEFLVLHQLCSRGHTIHSPLSPFDEKGEFTLGELGVLSIQLCMGGMDLSLSPCRFWRGAFPLFFMFGRGKDPFLLGFFIVYFFR